MKFHETVIIGAGPGGLACALALARQGRDVLLLEKKQLIGRKVCAGGVTWSGLYNRIPADLIEQTFSSQHIHSRRQHAVISSSTPMIATVSREKMGQWQSQEARQAGVHIITGAHVRTVTDSLVITNQGSYRYRYLVGADGSTSLVRAYLHLPIEDVGVGINYQISGNFPRMEWHLNAKLFSSGYAWIFPHRNHTSIGAYSSRCDLSAKTLHDRLRQWATKQKINLDGSRPRAALINFDYRGWRFGNIFLVGDAAGLASGLTGEGIFPAILSGEAVAHAIIGQDHHPQTALLNLLKKHQTHRRFLKLTSTNSFACTAIMELMVAALRMRLIPWNALEMGV